MAISNNVNSAIIAGQFGLQQSFEGMTQSALNIAQRTAQQDVAQNGTGNFLADASLRSLSTTSKLLPQGGDSLTTDLISMQLYTNNALASAKVLDVANDTVGRIIDTIA